MVKSSDHRLTHQPTTPHQVSLPWLVTERSRSRKEESKVSTNGQVRGKQKGGDLEI